MVVLLPNQADAAPAPSHPLRLFLERELAEREIVFLDLIAGIQSLPPRKLAELFIKKGSGVHEFAGEHYSVEGNQYIAGLLHEALATIPEISTTRRELSPQGEAVP